MLFGDYFAVDRGWRHDSQIAHYVADKPEGPFKFSEISLKGTEENIWDRYAPHNPQQLIDRLKDDTFRDAQRRRSQTEARISILSHCFCGVPMKQKGFEHRQIHMGLSVLSHNLWVLGRLKIAQE